MSSLSMLEWALRYHEAGWPIMPVEGKIPLLKTWKHLQTQMPREDEVRRWFGHDFPTANIGLVCGKLSDITVIDVDWVKDEHKNILRDQGETPAALVATLPYSMTSITGSDGRHRFFRYADIKNSAKTVHPQMDVRSEGGFVVLPPSIHPDTGATYTWDPLFPFEENNLGENLGEVPENIIEAASVYVLKGEGRDWAPIIKGVGTGSRNVSAAQIAGKIIRTFRDDPMNAWQFVKDWNKHNQPPLEEGELWSVFHSILKRDYANNANKYEQPT